MTPELRRAQLIATATVLFATRPAHEVNVDDIVTAAGVSRALFYRYFSGPDEIFEAAARQVADGLVDRWRRLPHDRPLVDLLTVAVDDFIAVAEQNPAAYVALVGNSSVLGLSSGGDGVIESVRAAIVDEIRSRLGLDGLGPFAAHTLELWLTVVEATVLAWLRDRTLPREQLTRWLIAQLVAMTTTTAAFDATARDMIARALSSQL